MRNLLKSLFAGSDNVRSTSSKKETASMIRSTHLGQLALGLLVAFAGSAKLQAIDLIFTAQEVGADVVTSVSGFVNTTGLTNTGSANGRGRFAGTFIGGSVIQVGPSLSYNNWGGVTGSAVFGSGSQTFATTNTGNNAGIGTYSSGFVLFLPQTYVSGASMSGTSTYTGKTLADLGMTVGTYNWTWGSGANAGTAQLTISAVPEPSTYALAAIATSVMAYLARRRKARTA
jgi:hypothetical protein